MNAVTVNLVLVVVQVHFRFLGHAEESLRWKESSNEVVASSTIQELQFQPQPQSQHPFARVVDGLSRMVRNHRHKRQQKHKDRWVEFHILSVLLLGMICTYRTVWYMFILIPGMYAKG